MVLRLALQQLTDVCISNNKLCDRVATDIAESLRKNSTLTRLDLSHNNIRDKGTPAPPPANGRVLSVTPRCLSLCHWPQSVKLREG